MDLSAYYDGELEGEDLNSVEQHLASCSTCRGTLGEMGRISSALHGLMDNRDQGRSLLEKIISRLAEEEDADQKILS